MRDTAEIGVHVAVISKYRSYSTSKRDIRGRSILIFFLLNTVYGF